MKKIFSYAAIALAVVMLASCAGSKKVGLQLYSVHQDMGNVEAS